MVDAARWLLRHGETEGGEGFRGHTDDRLTPAGRQAMFETVRGLEAPHLVVTSPLVRCRAFAESYARRRGAALHVEADLRELHFGEWEGRTAGDVLRESPATLEAFWRDPASTTPPGGEPFAEFAARITGAWRRIEQRSERRILVVSHAGPIRLILLGARQLPLSSLFDLPVPRASLHCVN